MFRSTKDRAHRKVLSTYYANKRYKTPEQVAPHFREPLEDLRERFVFKVAGDRTLRVSEKAGSKIRNFWDSYFGGRPADFQVFNFRGDYLSWGYPYHLPKRVKDKLHTDKHKGSVVREGLEDYYRTYIELRECDCDECRTPPSDVWAEYHNERSVDDHFDEELEQWVFDGKLVLLGPELYDVRYWESIYYA